MRDTSYRLPDCFEPIHPLVRHWALDVCEHELPGQYDSADDRIADIENRHVPGFVPFTDGGAEVVIPALVDYCHSSGCVPDAIQPYLDSALKDADEEWDRLHSDHPVAWLYAEDASPDEGTQRERLKEDYWEHLDDWLREGFTFFWKVRAIYYGPLNSGNESSQPEVLFCVGINTDFEYGRDTIPWLTCYGQKPQQTRWVWEAHVAVENITPDLLTQLANDAREALAYA